MARRHAAATGSARLTPSASLAQLVDVIAPIVTDHGEPAWRQTTFFAFAFASRPAGARHPACGRGAHAWITDSTFPAGSVNQAISGPPFRKIPASSVSAGVPV